MSHKNYSEDKKNMSKANIEKTTALEAKIKKLEKTTALEAKIKKLEKTTALEAKIKKTREAGEDRLH